MLQRIWLMIFLVMVGSEPQRGGIGNPKLQNASSWITQKPFSAKQNVKQQRRDSIATLRGENENGWDVTKTSSNKDNDTRTMESKGNTVTVTRNEGGPKMTNVSEALGYMIWQVIERYASSCLLVMVTTNKDTLFQQLLRFSNAAMQPNLIFDVSQQSRQNDTFRDDLIWGTSLTTCRFLLLHLLDAKHSGVYRFLREAQLWLWPSTKTLIVGGKENVLQVFDQDALRNTLDIVYLGIPDDLINTGSGNTVPHSVSDLSQSEQTVRKGASNIVSVYSRCFYCPGGESKKLLLFLWYIGSSFPEKVNFFPDQLQDFRGHRFRIVSVTFFPYMDYTVDSTEAASTVTPQDCMDFRMLKAFVKALNFTYEIRAPWDMQWGNPIGNGNWSGIVGTLQYEKADFSTVMAPNSGRLTVLSHARAYTADTLVVTSLKPRPLTQYLLVVRPFGVDVWIPLLITIIIWGLVLWLMQKALFRMFGGRTKDPISSIFYGLGLLLEDPPSDYPTNVTMQMLVGWWLVFCLVITTGFRSSLVAHLTVQAKFPPIDSLQDLIKQQDWSWAIDIKMLQGAALNFFQSSTDPVVKKVHEKLEILPQEDGLKRILKGSFSYLAWKNNVFTAIESYHTDEYGRSPYYIGKRGSPMLTDFGWGFRKGAPFQARFSQMMNRLIEAGIIDRWNDEVMNDRVKRIRKGLLGQKTASSRSPEIDETHIPLNIGHLQGIFYLTFAGYGLAFLLLIGENLIHKYYKASK